MAGWIQNQLKDAAGAFFGSDYLRDYTHASKTFRTNGYQYAPKLKFLFHVYFDINTEALSQNVSTGANFGLDVKTIKLPSFNFMTHDLNQYNRKRIVQTKIKYDPIDIHFHDDNGNMINSLWYSYYTYYYKDANSVNIKLGKNAPPPTYYTGEKTSTKAINYNERTTYADSISGDDTWGYIGETSSPNPEANPAKAPFFKNITVFGFNQHNFIAYTLVNPIITRFAHDTYDYSQNGGIMENVMTLDYETVSYHQGALDGNKPSDIVTGFGEGGYYDRTVSPIAQPGSNSSILGKGGLIDAAGGAIGQLGTNPLAAIKTLGTAYNTSKSINLGATLKAEAGALLQNALVGAIQGNQNPTRNVQFGIPVYGATPSTQGTAGTPTGQTAADLISSGLTSGINAITNAGKVVTNNVTSYLTKPAPIEPPNP